MDIREQIIDHCKLSINAVHEAHELCRRKASEVLLFLLTDTDREYSKDKPSVIPIAYALKGKSLRVSICRKMMNDVRDFLKDKGISVLVEAYDGQWSGLVFRDQDDQPLTLFELQRKIWLQFASMSKDNLLKAISELSTNLGDTLTTWSTMSILRPGVYKYGNIRVSLAKHTKETLIPVHMMKCKRYMCIESFCNDFQSEGGFGMIKFPHVNNRPELWQVCLTDRNLLHMWGKRKLIVTRSNNLSQSSDLNIVQQNQDIENLEHAAVEVNMHDNDDNIDNYAANFMATDSGHIRNLLMTSHSHIMHEIIFCFCVENVPISGVVSMHKHYTIQL